MKRGMTSKPDWMICSMLEYQRRHYLDDLADILYDAGFRSDDKYIIIDEMCIDEHDVDAIMFRLVNYERNKR